HALAQTRVLACIEERQHGITQRVLGGIGRTPGTQQVDRRLMQAPRHPTRPSRADAKSCSEASIDASWCLLGGRLTCAPAGRRWAPGHGAPQALTGSRLVWAPTAPNS